MTRLNPIYTRIYLNGYDLSGSARDAGGNGFNTDMPMEAAYSDGVKNGIPGDVSIVCGPLNAFFSPATSPAIGIHELLKGGNVISDVLIAFGAAEPAAGSPMFAWKMQQGEYFTKGEGIVGVNIALRNAAYNTIKGYGNPFGYLAHAKGAETGVNTAVGVIDAGAQSTKGGIFVYQLFSSDGTVTLSLEEASTNTNPNFAALTGATSGSIDASVAPKSGMVALATDATVKRYIRWQLALGTAANVNFACGFIRG